MVLLFLGGLLSLRFNNCLQSPFRNLFKVGVVVCGVLCFPINCVEVVVVAFCSWWCGCVCWFGVIGLVCVVVMVG